MTLTVQETEVIERNGAHLQPPVLIYRELNAWGKEGFELDSVLPLTSPSPRMALSLLILKRAYA